MPKSPLEKQLEKNRLEIKRQAEKDRKEAQKRAYEEQIRQQAASIVNAQDVIDGFRVIDRVSESVLKTLLELCTNKETGRVSYENTAFDVPIQGSIGLELEKLTQYGLLHIYMKWMGGGIVDLLPTAFTYFEDKTAALQRKEQLISSATENHFYGNTNVITSAVSSSVIVAGDGNNIFPGDPSRSRPAEEKPGEETMEHGFSNKVFISHRKLDEAVAGMLFDFLIAAGIPREAIFCSSLPGNDVKEFISKEVRQALQASQVNIAILSGNYYESAYCVNEAGVLWYLEDIRVIPIALPEIQPDDMIGFLNQDYRVRRLDNTDDITYIYDTITDILGVPQQKSSVINTECKKLIARYNDYLSQREVPVSEEECKSSAEPLEITVSKFEVKNSQPAKMPTFEFEVILCNQTDKTLSVYEKYLHFFKGDQELKKVEVSRFEVHSRKDALDELFVLEPVNRIVTLAPGHAECVGILGDYNEISDADRITFSCVANRQEYSISVCGEDS